VKVGVKIGIFSLFLLVAVTAIVFFVRQKEVLNQDTSGLTANYPLIKADRASSFNLNCRLQINKIERKPDQIGDLVILRSAPCIYSRADGKTDVVEIPLAFFNKSSNQFFLVNSAVSDLGMPGDGYIDGLIADLYLMYGDQPLVSFWSESENATENEQIIQFFANTRQTLPESWAEKFSAFGEKKYLPKTMSGKIVFLAINFVYHTTTP
jgi:hypothetical protein